LKKRKARKGEKKEERDGVVFNLLPTSEGKKEKEGGEERRRTIIDRFRRLLTEEQGKKRGGKRKDSIRGEKTGWLWKGKNAKGKKIEGKKERKGERKEISTIPAFRDRKEKG